MLYQNLGTLISNLDSAAPPKDRVKVLQPLVDFIQEKFDRREDIRLNFICTHNSRRSHMAQIWAQTMAYHFDINNCFCYSGGTESTALFPKVAETMQNLGFEVLVLSKGENPLYGIKFSENNLPIIGFSKKWNDPFNPRSTFAAIMTCSQADEDCPFISGAEKRIPVTYDDPKAFDHSPQQTDKYKERSLQIASEMYHVFKHIKSK